MKRETLCAASAVLILLSIGCQPAQRTKSTSPTTVTNDAEAALTTSDPKQLALSVRDDLLKSLSTRLVAAMSNGGPATAIEVCAHDAPKLAAEVGEERGVTIGRTSFKLRNPKNKPPEWAKSLIEEKSSEPEFVELPNGGTGALLPIKLKTQCLVCHGATDQIADDVKAKLTELYPDDQATGFKDGDLRGWFWAVVPSDSQSQPIASNHTEDDLEEDKHDHAGPGMMGRGRGMMGRGHGGGNREDMTTLHAMFADRDKITRTITILPNGAEATTESDDAEIAGMIQEHVPAMEGRVMEDNPLPPMTFHPIFVELINHADDYTLTYEDTDKGIKVKYSSDDPYVVMLVQEHAKLVSRFIKNGMEEIHKPYTLPSRPGNDVIDDHRSGA